MNVKSYHGELFTTESLDIYILNQVHGARAHTHTHKITATCETSLTIREIPICTAGGCGKTAQKKRWPVEKKNFSI